MLSVIAISLFFIPNFALASVALSGTVQVPFYKSTQSVFPSGYGTTENLLKLQTQKTLLPESVYRWNSKTFGRDELRPVLPVHLSQYVFDVQTQQRWKVIETGLQDLKVENLVTRNTIQFSNDEVISDPYDLGYAITLKDAYLKQGAEQNSKILTTISQGTRLRPLEYKNSFFKVRYKDYVGYVSLSEALTKFDLCTMVFAFEKWHFVKKRQFDMMITNDDTKIQLNHVQRLVTPDTRGIIASATQKIPLWSQVEIIKSLKTDWVQSVLKGHGQVWWKFPNSQSNADDEPTILIDQLIRQPISSVSFHPRNPLKGIISSNGVYLTEDGLHWKRIKQFENFNGPVHYFNDLLIFVGQHRSVNGGKSFENYIQIDKLAQAIESQYGFLPKRLQVRHIETKAPFRLKIEIETGSRKIIMESPLFTQDWKAVKI